MKALRLVQPGLPLELHDIPLPHPGEDDVLVRVKAAGICHSDAHYRAGRSRVDPLPLTLGHEVAGVVEAIGRKVKQFRVGERVCLHYMATCGRCIWCGKGHEQFCETGAMIGKSRDGGYAEFIVMPARSVFPLPDEIPFEHGAIMMCSSATSLHALAKARMKPGESVAVFGAGGLGMSAIQLAQALGASKVFAVDIHPDKLALAESLGADPIDARAGDPVKLIRDRTGGQGVDVALELIGLPLTMEQSVRALARQGRAALAGITEGNFEVTPYHELINREAEIIGVSDHLAAEIPVLLEFARIGKLNLSNVVTRTVPLEANAINDALDRLEHFGEDLRVVITS
ncbi:MAG: alcohol dehydrogenase catalytic domain-containing protein [Chthoniobacterales bacterium]